MNDTPRTDKEAITDNDGSEVVMADFARELERELTIARAALKACVAAVETNAGLCANDHETENARRILAKSP